MHVLETKYRGTAKRREGIESTQISIVLPTQLLKAADYATIEIGCSRSWLITEALRRYLGAGREASV